MEDTIVFYHFNTKEVMDQTPMKDSDIAFCKETRTIKTHGIEYCKFEWEEIPSVANNTSNN